MKKLTTLLLAAGLVFAASAPASAVDVKMDGYYNFQFTRGAGVDFAKDSADFDRARQLVRLGMTTSVSENLSGYFQIDSKWSWGNNTDTEGVGGTAFNGAAVDVRMYQAYVDWMIPQTTVKVRMGRQKLTLPALANGKNPGIWHKDPVDGISISSPVTDWLSLTAWWGRYNRTAGYRTAAIDVTGAKNDVFAVIADLAFDGFKFSPFVAYASYGETQPSLKVNNNDSDLNKLVDAKQGPANAYWLGFTGSMTLFDPFVAKLGFMYGDKDFSDNRGDNSASQHGWVVDTNLTYKTAYVTPGLMAWYGSGDTSGVDYAYQNYMPSQGGRFKGSYGFFNGSGLEDNELQNGQNMQGSWGIRLGADNISFLQDLSHSVAVVYARGTNAQPNAEFGIAPHRYMTSKDSIVEFDFGTTYQIYKNFAAYLECAYVLENFETNDKGTGHFGSRADSYDDAWKVALQFSYRF